VSLSRTILRYQVLSSMAWMVAGIAESAATDLWQDVLKLGPGYYHHFVGHSPPVILEHGRPGIELLLSQFSGGRCWNLRCDRSPGPGGGIGIIGKICFDSFWIRVRNCFLITFLGIARPSPACANPYEQWAKKYTA